MKTKPCKICHKEKKLTEYYKMRGIYLYPYCKDCLKLKVSKWAKKNPERRREVARNSMKRRYWERKALQNKGWLNRLPTGLT